MHFGVASCCPLLLWQCIEPLSCNKWHLLLNGCLLMKGQQYEPRSRQALSKAEEQRWPAVKHRAVQQHKANLRSNKRQLCAATKGKSVQQRKATLCSNRRQKCAATKGKCDRGNGPCQQAQDFSSPPLHSCPDQHPPAAALGSSLPSTACSHCQTHAWRARQRCGLLAAACSHIINNSFGLAASA